MLSTLFKAKPVIDESSKKWIFDTFAWCISQLDSDFFTDNSELILPNNSFYPGSSSSVEEMAGTIFSHTLKYTGMQNWPIRLAPIEGFTPKPMPKLAFPSKLRGENCEVSAGDISFTINNETILPSIDIPFHHSQLNQPEDLIAYLVQSLAGILLTQQGGDAPGGEELRPQTIDLIAVFMGFGVIFSNTAYQFKGGCGSCNNRNLNRQAALPELETVYALALFCVLKGSDIKIVKKSLKSHLYKAFRQAYKEINILLQENNKHEQSNLNKLSAHLNNSH